MHNDIYEEFREGMVKTVKSYRVGNGLQKNGFLGPVQNHLQFDRVKEFLEDIRMNEQVVCLGEIYYKPKGGGCLLNQRSSTIQRTIAK